MLKTKVKKIPEFVEIAYEAKKTAFLWGAPGIGKSTAIRDAAKLLSKKYGEEFQVIDVRLSQLDPTDLGGIPVPKDGKMDRYYPSWWPTKGRGIIFFDEMNKGTPSVQAAAYQMVLDRKMGDVPLGEGWMVVAAGNRSSDKVTVYDLDSALQNRFALHIEVECPNNKELMDYFESIGKGDAQVAGFTDFKPSHIFFRNDKTGDPAWASPRTWEQFIDMKMGKKGPIIRDIAHACLGEVVGREFYAYIRLAEEVNIDDILQHPEKFRNIQKRDVQHSVITEIAERVKKDAKLEKNAMLFLFEIENPEHTLLAMSLIVKNNVGFFDRMMEKFPKEAEKMSKYLEKILR